MTKESDESDESSESEDSNVATDLCIGGGSYKGIGFIGALEYITRTQKLNLKRFFGCSIGSMIGVFYIIGITPLNLFDRLLDIDLTELCDLNIKNIDNYSLLSDKLFVVFKGVFAEYVKEDITFAEFYEKYLVDINILTVSVSTKESVTFCKKSHPNTKVFDALTASCSIPFVFPPVKINGHYYIDGCAKNISGCVKEYINGYTIKLSSDDRCEIESLKEYSMEVLYTLTGDVAPNTRYLIDIPTETHFKSKANFIDLTYSEKVRLYYNGIKEAEKSLTSSCNN